MDVRESSENPYYVLATLYGEQTAEHYDIELLKKNRRFWNGWFCGELSEYYRQQLAREADIEPSELLSLSDEELIEAKEAFRKRLPEQELPDQSANIFIAGSRHANSIDYILPIDAHLVMRGYVFTKSFNLFARISGHADFQHAVFTGPTGILSTEFNGSALFDKSSFRSANAFLGCICDATARFSKAKFIGPSTFVNTQFRDDANFTGANFNVDANFKDTLFQGRATFSKCRISGDFHFRDAKLEGELDFSHTHFLSDVSLPLIFATNTSFARAIFDGVVRFDDATFPKSADFSKAEFNGPASFANCVFGGMADFRDSRFDRPANFRTAVFSKHVPQLEGAIIHPDTIFSTDAKHWPRDQDVAADVGRLAFGKIRHSTSKQGLPEEEHWFFRREMRFAARSGNFWQRLPYQLYWKSSVFGNSIILPVAWMAVTLVAFWAAFYFIDFDIFANQSSMSKIWSSLSLSFANMFPFLGLHARFISDYSVSGTFLLMLFSTIQMIISVFLLFLIGLGLRNRFRLK